VKRFRIGVFGEITFINDISDYIIIQGVSAPFFYVQDTARRVG
jgi:hypothetical protein